MIPATHNLNIYQDRDFSQTFFLKCDGAKMELEAYEARAEIRQSKGAANLILAFTLVKDVEAGSITISLTDVQTLALRITKGFWDLALTDSATLRQNYIEGTVTVKGTVTRQEVSP